MQRADSHAPGPEAGGKGSQRKEGYSSRCCHGLEVSSTLPVIFMHKKTNKESEKQEKEKTLAVRREHTSNKLLYRISRRLEGEERKQGEESYELIR